MNVYRIISESPQVPETSELFFRQELEALAPAESADLIEQILEEESPLEPGEFDGESRSE